MVEKTEQVKKIKLADFGGAITLAKCRELFGKEKAKEMLDALSLAGGYGFFNENEAETVFLAIPIEDEACIELEKVLK